MGYPVISLKHQIICSKNILWKYLRRLKDWDFCRIERVMEVISVADALRWPTFVLIGHSMGGMISILTAGTIPTRVEKVIILVLDEKKKTDLLIFF